MSEEELKRFKEKQKYKNELFNDFALDSWCEESETINRAINRLTKEHFALLDIKEYMKNLKDEYADNDYDIKNEVFKKIYYEIIDKVLGGKDE